MHAHRSAARLAGAALVLAGLLAGCLGDDAGSNDPAANDPDVLDPGAGEPGGEDGADAGAVGNEGAEDPAADDGTLPDGEHQGRLRHIDEGSVTVEVVRVLDGEAAVAAAEADGVDVGEGLPNDAYVQDVGETYVLLLAGDAGARIIDCSAGCEEVDTTIAALASGEATPYGGPNAIVAITIDGGEVVSLAELYLP
jgi:major membrane immunogen (membrane-anchored lipoprotein)